MISNQRLYTWPKIIVTIMSKLALIYSGQPRHLRECHENHVKNFYQEGWDVDVFAHVWYDKSWVGAYFWDQYKDRGRWDAELIPYMEENWKPKALEFEEPKDFESDWVPDPRFPHPVNNIISDVHLSVFSKTI